MNAVRISILSVLLLGTLTACGGDADGTSPDAGGDASASTDAGSDVDTAPATKACLPTPAQALTPPSTTLPCWLRPPAP